MFVPICPLNKHTYKRKEASYIFEIDKLPNEYIFFSFYFAKKSYTMLRTISYRSCLRLARLAEAQEISFNIGEVRYYTGDCSTRVMCM